MPCKISCAISAVFFIAMIFMMSATSQNNIIKKYENQLSDELKITYKNIVNDRLQNYYIGYTLGFFLALIILFYNYRFRKIPASSLSVVCTVVALSFLVNYFYYILSPKKDWMLNHIKTPEETKAWLEMYRGMQYYYHGGLAIGLLAVGIFAFAFCK
jgi:glucan phosphoethanolaminetransferase (alkaline phosphatase superfamily)